MSIFRAATDLRGRRQCRRCLKFFLPRKEGQEYGPKCERKIAQILIEERLDTRPHEQAPEKKAPQLSAEESAVAAYRGAVLA